MENETKECMINEFWLAGQPWPWLGVSFDDGVRVGCPQEIAARCGVWLCWARVGGGSSVNVESSPILGNAEKGCIPLKCCAPRG